MAVVITPQELKALMGSGQKPTLIDVRRKADFEAAPKKIESAAWLDPERANEWIAKIPQDRAVVVYCVKGGAVSQGIADRLEQSRHDVKFLQGGIKAWAEYGELLED
jgi:rhodanese-related sulfurtransferase